MASQDKLTGSGPTDPEEKVALRATGWQPNSIKIGNKFYSYNRLDPLGFVVGIAADLLEIAERLGEAEADKVLAMSIAAFTQTMLDKSYMTGLTDFTNVLSDPERYGDRWFARFAQSSVPFSSFLRQTGNAIDPTLRDASDINEKLMELLPESIAHDIEFLTGVDVPDRGELEPRVDIFGEPIIRGGAFGPDILSPIYVSTQSRCQ